MSFINRIKQKILENSDTYNNCQNENSNLKRELKNIRDSNEKDRMHFNDEIQKLSKKQLLLEETLDSHYHLLNTLMLDYDLKPKGILKNMQDLCQELLNFVVIVCNKNDLDYWLVGGNLLGAVRHGAFIPWDDDMDVGMIRKEYYKFNSVIYDEVKDNGFDSFISIEVYPRKGMNFINAFTKIDCLSNQNMILAGIDIFPYDYAMDKNFSKDEFCDYRNEYFKRLLNDDEENLIKEYYDKFNLNWDDGKYIIPNPTVLRYAERYRKDLIFWEKEKVMPFNSLKFNDKYYNCPNDSHYFLEMEFGDYNNIPRIIRDQHFNVDKLRNIENIEDQFEDIISKLKYYNEKFL